MRPTLFRSIFVTALGLATVPALLATAEETRVTFPDLDALIHYTTVTRGDVTEHMLTTQAAIDAVQAGQPIPDGTPVVLADYREGEVYRYFVMQKGAGWGADYDDGRRTGDWQFQFYWGDRSINMEENTARCQGCHQSREDAEFMFTYNDLRRFGQ